MKDIDIQEAYKADFENRTATHCNNTWTHHNIYIFVGVLHKVWRILTVKRRVKQILQIALQHTATHCNNTWTHCNTFTMQVRVLQYLHDAITQAKRIMTFKSRENFSCCKLHCNTLQHTATTHEHSARYAWCDDSGKTDNIQEACKLFSRIALQHTAATYDNICNIFITWLHRQKG